jgi:hypothetical protein
MDGTAQHDAFAVKFDLPHAAVGAAVLRIEAERKGKRVEPELCSRSMCETLAERFPFRLKKAG